MRVEVAILLRVLTCPRAIHMARTRRLTIDNSNSNSKQDPHLQNRREHTAPLHVIVDDPANRDSPEQHSIH
jgi:hypothetical protein